MMTTELTLAYFVSTLKEIQDKVQALDPEGTDDALRLTVSASLYTAFDTLRCQDRPFHREAFADRLQVIEDLLRQYPKSRVRVRPDIPRQDTEAFVAELYSQCWSNYDDDVFVETVGLFEERFRLNRVDLGFLRGAECLDAGCGSGRYTVAMTRLGARKAIGIDLSERAVQEATQRSRRLGFGDTVVFRQGSVIDMPREWTDAFDFVCSSGVVHHTLNPVKGLQEIFRVLRPGGKAYVLVYGAGGLFWELVDMIRGCVTSVPLAFAHTWLKSLGMPPGKIFNYLDHWYTPIQERVTQEEFENRLTACGFRRLISMPRGRVYEPSERRHRFVEEQDLIGDGDLRYLVEKP